MRKTKLGALLASVLLAACYAEPPNHVTKVAEYYVLRLADTTRTDSAATALSASELGTLTAGWTASEWQEFWKEVEKLRRR